MSGAPIAYLVREGRAVTEPNLRYPLVTRRAFLGGLSLAAIASTAACSGSDSTATDDASGQSGEQTSTADTTGTVQTSTSDSSADGSSAGSGDTLPTTASATVSWTFGGQAMRNPYMAVWIEDADGAFVKTLALYHRAEGDRWLDTLVRWYQVSGGTDTTTSGTVPAGTYTAAWDGTTASGERASAGSYYVCVESAVEHGDESLVREAVTFDAEAGSTTLTPAGDITSASVDYSV